MHFGGEMSEKFGYKDLNSIHWLGDQKRLFKFFKSRKLKMKDLAAFLIKKESHISRYSQLVHTMPKHLFNLTKHFIENTWNEEFIVVEKSHRLDKKVYISDAESIIKNAHSDIYYYNIIWNLEEFKESFDLDLDGRYENFLAELEEEGLVEICSLFDENKFELLKKGIPLVHYDSPRDGQTIEPVDELNSEINWAIEVLGHDLQSLNIYSEEEAFRDKELRRRFRDEIALINPNRFLDAFEFLEKSTIYSQYDSIAKLERFNIEITKSTSAQDLEKYKEIIENTKDLHPEYRDGSYELENTLEFLKSVQEDLC